MQKWKAHYNDAEHDLDIEIINNENPTLPYTLSFTIDGVEFVGTSPADFELSQPEKYDFESGIFNFLKHGGHRYCGTFHYTLQRYSMSIKIPFPVTDRKFGETIDSYIDFEYSYRERNENDRNNVRYLCGEEYVYHDVQEVKHFSLVINEKEVYGSECKSLWFEDNLLKIYRQIKDKYDVKCCFTCQYSDYSPYGSDDFGTMLCYRKHKSEYLKVNDKDTYFKYAGGLEYEQMQETQLCSDYEPRCKCEGYRGFIE